ncbi:porin [Pelovirga terrestris]|uniref:Porin n=1 Tax=Pelovirga terrestris TaxID=2771352 RepID=A0A8J6R697_9BACT|nr:porin [Pelovirga terrestris]MBD1401139.1 porin [Pelovirga terrestris]
MSRLVSLLIVLLAIAVATPVLAEQRLSLSGQMRVRGYYTDGPGFDTDAKSTSTFNQRLRLFGNIAAAEGVSVHFRQDFSTGTWDESKGTPSTSTRPEAWLNVDKGMFNIKAGRMYYRIGNAIVADHVAGGAVFTLKGAVPVEFAYFKLEENDVAKDDDLDFYTLAVRHKTDMYNAVVFGGLLRDGGSPTNTTKSSTYAVGTQANFKLDPVNINFEANYFTGEEDISGGEKYRGLQVFTDIGMKVTETVNAGLILAYAKGYDDKVQVSNLTNDAYANGAGRSNGIFMPETNGFFTAGFTPLYRSNNQIFRISHSATASAGSRLVQGYVRAKVMDPLSVHMNVGYGQPDEKIGTDYVKSITYANISSRYQLAARTNLDTVYSYAKPKVNGTLEDDAKQILAFNLNVNF